ncbi:hypothetical protein K505DRAFT_368496 [Melanomma pulvis-pyrius CBS 109.77]|uniref:Uncharacterized protein n=1 Tax=Melanomma pulvis-pyrius CBS 109.77 TaxID=1314802 RepID=A0A6A6WQD5_9PLEO|nr:hypothetical protein K505DRAFT_368496 [Melanomma pulvis-pyrius CBS 109.77]
MARSKPANLESLAQELLDLILSHLLINPEKRRSLLSVRYTSRRLYHSTHTQFAAQFRKKLRLGQFQVTVPYLSLLLHLTELPIVRDEIHTLTLVHGRENQLECETRKNNSSCRGHEPPIKNPMAWRAHYLCWEERKEAEESTEAFHLLVQILKNLKIGSALKGIHIEAAWEIAIAAVEASGVNENVTHIKKLWDNTDYRVMSPHDYLHDHAFRDRYEWHGTKQASLVQQGPDESYATAKGSISTSILSFRFLPGLLTLNLYDVSIHGTLLRQFLMLQTGLMRLDMIYVNLTASSWKKVFRAMRYCESSQPEYLSVAHLFQRAGARRRKQGINGRVSCPVNRIGCFRDSMLMFLDGMCRDFRLRRADREFWYEVEFPVIWGVSHEKSIDAPLRLAVDLDLETGAWSRWNDAACV